MILLCVLFLLSSTRSLSPVAPKSLASATVVIILLSPSSATKTSENAAASAPYHKTFHRSPKDKKTLSLFMHTYHETFHHVAKKTTFLFIPTRQMTLRALWPRRSPPLCRTRWRWRRRLMLRGAFGPQSRRMHLVYIYGRMECV